MTTLTSCRRWAALGLTAFSLAAVAAPGDKAVYDQARGAAKNQYEAAKKQCDTLKDNAEDICEAEAKLARVKADSEAEASYKNTARARQKSMEDVAKAEYELAEERCDDMPSAEEKACESQAKATRDKAMADAKALK